MKMRAIAGVITTFGLLVSILAIPVSPVLSARQDDALRAADAAVELSEYEAEGTAGRLYEQMHLDAKVLIPPEAVIGWYETAFFPLAPKPITVTGVKFVDWTWGVTGVTYPDTAEVSYMQDFGSGERVSEIVHLVEEDGEWHWFFGRSQAFVNDQIRQQAPDAALLDDSAADAAFPADGAAPWGLETFAASGIDADALLAAFPETIGEHRLDRIESGQNRQGVFPEIATDITIATYLDPPETVIPSGETQVLRLKPEIDATQALETIIDASRESPHFVVLRQSDERSGGMVFLLVELYTNDAVGNVPVLFWGKADGDVLVAASMRDFISLRVLVQELAA